MTTRALITGATGMVGSHLVEYLIAHTSWEIHCLVRWRSSLENLASVMTHINRGDRIFLHYGDLNDDLSLRVCVKKVKPNYTFHLAAQSYPQSSFIAPCDTLQTNIQGTFRLLEALREFCHDTVVHVCASSEVYGRVPKEKVPIDESCTFHPASPYAISKVGTDLAGRYFAEAFGMTVMTTRMFTHTGPRRGDVFAESSFAKQIAMAEFGLGPKVIKVGNLKSLRTIADVRDAVEAYYLLVTQNPIAGESYNIGGLSSFTIEQILEYLVSQSSISGLTWELDPTRLRPIDADLQIPNMRKFQDKTGWMPKYSFEQTMGDLLEYWRKKLTDGPNLYTSR